MGEFDYIGWLRGQYQPRADVVIGPGDDCAVVRSSEGLQLMTTDMLMDGVDFLLKDVGPRRVGRKAMAVNLSDIAAMAGVPRTALVSVALPKGLNIAEELYHGLHEMADRFDVGIVGGDTNSWHGPLVISIALHGDVTERGFVTRGGARPGDWLFVTGPLGGSIHGHHLDFTPRVREALALHQQVRLKAMIDVSDGLTQDLQHILDESRCGAVLENIPVRDGATLEGALTDGEDFELVFAVSPNDGMALMQRGGVWKIGECVELGLFLLENGVRRALTPRGWIHSL